MSDADTRLALLAADQDGVFHRTQALEAGLSRFAIGRRLRSGTFVAVATHTMRFAGTPESWRGQLWAGLLDLGAEAVIGGRASAASFELDGFEEGSLSFYVPRELRGRRTKGVVRSGDRLGLVDRCTVAGFPSLSPTRLLIELAAECNERELGNAVDSALRKGLTSVPFLLERLAAVRRPGMPGIERLDRVLDSAGVQSFLERRFLALVREAGLPEPAKQRVYRSDGHHVARVDFDFDPHPVIIEVGGRKGYETRDDLLRKERRRRSLQLLGKVVYFFASEEVAGDPGMVLATLRQALAGEVGDTPIPDPV